MKRIALLLLALALVSFVFPGLGEDVPIIGPGGENPESNPIIGPGGENPESNPIIGPGGENPNSYPIIGPGGENPNSHPIVGPGGENPNSGIIDPVLHVYMYVETNGGHLNVRSNPSSNARIIGRLEFGEQVLVTGFSSNRTWARILYRNATDGYVLASYLSEYEPEPTPDPYPYPTYYPYPTDEPYPPYIPTPVPYPTVPPYQPSPDYRELNMEFDSMTVVPNQQYRVSTYNGVPLYWAPTTGSSIQRYCNEGEIFIVLAYNRNWVQVRDDINGFTGFLQQSQTR